MINPPMTFAQEESDPIINRQLWLDYYAYYYFKPKWQFYGDVGWRTDLKEFDWMMIYARPSAHWYANKNIDIRNFELQTAAIHFFANAVITIKLIIYSMLLELKMKLVPFFLWKFDALW